MSMDCDSALNLDWMSFGTILVHAAYSWMQELSNVVSVTAYLFELK